MPTKRKPADRQAPDRTNEERQGLDEWLKETRDRLTRVRDTANRINGLLAAAEDTGSTTSLAHIMATINGYVERLAADNERAICGLNMTVGYYEGMSNG